MDPFEKRNAPRSIPTCVGSMETISRSTLLSSVHPHVRGEHEPPVFDDGRVVGPSPRAWGSLAHMAPAWSDLRSIPTCVGLTP